MTDIDKERGLCPADYWYKFYVGWCPVCGHESVDKERVHDRPKPDDAEERYSYAQVYCGCMDSELYSLVDWGNP